MSKSEKPKNRYNLFCWPGQLQSRPHGGFDVTIATPPKPALIIGAIYRRGGLGRTGEAWFPVSVPRLTANGEVPMYPLDGPAWYHTPEEAGCALLNAWAAVQS